MNLSRKLLEPFELSEEFRLIAETLSAKRRSHPSIQYDKLVSEILKNDGLKRSSQEYKSRRSKLIGVFKTFEFLGVGYFERIATPGSYEIRKFNWNVDPRKIILLLNGEIESIEVSVVPDNVSFFTLINSSDFLNQSEYVYLGVAEKDAIFEVSIIRIPFYLGEDNAYKILHSYKNTHEDRCYKFTAIPINSKNPEF